VNVPKDTIERALKRASEINVESYTSATYEVFGFGGIY